MKAVRTRLIVALPVTLAVWAVSQSWAARADWRVWTTTGTKHVLRSEPPGDSRAAGLSAARNEWESFQILLRSDAPVPGVRVEPGDLHGPGGTVLEAAQARLYRQHQVFLKTGTYRNSAFKPDWYPDPLIAFGHPLTGKELTGGPFKAIPFDLPAGETHGFWVDLYVPANAAPGDYQGIYRVAAGAGQAVEIPVSLTVWGFALPEVPTLQTSFGSPAPRLREYYRQRAKTGQEPEPQDWAVVETQCARMMADHRLDACPPSKNLRPVAQPDGSFRIPPDQVAALREFVDRYHVNALDIPHPSSAVKDPVVERERLRAWLAAFDRAARELNRSNLVF